MVESGREEMGTTHQAMSSMDGLINSLPLPLVDLNCYHFTDAEIDFCRRSRGFVARRWQI